jgi:hypothetical protein
MLAVPAHGFVMLSLPKSASTSMVRAVQRHAEVVLRVNPGLKHLNCGQFHELVVPLLRKGGYRRKDYEVCSMFREPVEWLESWWRYRRRPEIEENADRFTGEQSFEAFALDYLDRPHPERGRPARFVAMSSELDIGVDRIFRLEAPEVWQSWLSEKIGQELTFPQANTSAERAEPELTAATRARLVEYFEPEYDIYDHLRGAGMWTPPKGYQPPHQF